MHVMLLLLLLRARILLLLLLLRARILLLLLLALSAGGWHARLPCP
jgi:hypothetical protein